MNKLYMVKIMLDKYDYVLGCSYFWNERDALEFLKSPEVEGLKSRVVEDNEIHKIWEVR